MDKPCQRSWRKSSQMGARVERATVAKRLDQSLPIPLIAGWVREVRECIGEVDRVPLDVRGFSEWKRVRYRLTRIVRAFDELQRMASWLKAD